MAVNRVDFGGNTLIDLTGDTLESADQLLKGIIAHAKDGSVITGLMEAGGGGGGIEEIDLYGFFTPAENDAVVTIDTGIEIAWNAIPNNKCMVAVWKNTPEKVNGSYAFIMSVGSSSGQTFSFGYRPSGDLYNTSFIASMKLTMSRNGTTLSFSVSGDTAANYTYGLVSGVEYGWLVKVIP